MIEKECDSCKHYIPFTFYCQVYDETRLGADCCEKWEWDGLE